MSVADEIINGTYGKPKAEQKKQTTTKQIDKKTKKKSVADQIISGEYEQNVQKNKAQAKALKTEQEQREEEIKKYVTDFTENWKNSTGHAIRAKDIINGTQKALKTVKNIRDIPKNVGTSLGEKAVDVGKSGVDYVKSGKAAKDITNVYKEGFKLATSPKEREKALKKLAVSAPMALVDLSKGAVGTMENWYETLREWDYEVNDKLAHKLGIIDDDELEKRKQQMIDDKTYDFTQNLYGRWGLYDEDVQRELRKNSYLTGTNGADQLLETAGQQLPSMAIADYFGRVKGGYDALNAAKTSLKGLKGAEWGKAALGNMTKSAVMNAPTNVEMALRSYGAAGTQALKEGATLEQAQKYALLSTLNEVATEYSTGGIPGIEESTGLLSNLEDSIINKATGKITNNTLKKGANKALKGVFEFAGEGSEEGLADLIDPLLKKWTYKQDEDIDWNQAKKNAWNSFLMGGGSALLLGGLGDVYNSYNNKQIQKQARLDNFSQQAMPKMAEIWQNQLQNGGLLNQTLNNQNQQTQQAQQIQQAIEQQQAQKETQNVLQNQNNEVQPTVTSVQQQTPVVEQENTPTINETTQDNINTQEQQNVVQNANNEVEQKQDYEGLNQKEYNEIQRRYKNLIEEIGFEEDLVENATPSEIIDQLKMIKETAYGGDGFLESARMEGPEVYRQTKSQYDKINRLINRFESKIGQQTQQDNISKQSEAFNLGKNENVETQTKPKGKAMSLQEISDRLGVKDNNVEKTTQQEQTNIKQQPTQTNAEAKEEQTNIPETKTEPVVKFDNETKKQTAKQITDTINNEIKSNEIIKNIEKEEGKPVRQGVKTITNATGTVQLISEMDNKVITYEPLSNEKVLNEVYGENRGKDLSTLYNECIDFIQSDKRIHAKDIAKIEMTLTELQNNFNQQENVDMFTDLVQQAATLGTTDAQALQFMSVIKKMNPMTQLTALQKAVENSIKKGDKAFEGVQIKQELVDKVLKAQQADGKIDQKAFDDSMNALMDDIASQMKVSFADKANNLRYLSMLCNFKTHLRNITGNTLMYELQSFKDIYATVGEEVYDRIQKARGKEGLKERTLTFKRATDEIKAFSEKKAAEIVKNQKNKYYESSKGIIGELKSRRNIWNNKNPIGKAANKLNKGNNFSLDIEDKMFSKAMTQKRLANYLTANMIKTQADIDAHPDIVARAIEYATYKGKEVTYHQENKIADNIRQFKENSYKGKGYSKLAGFGIDATLPFLNTPANIAKTGFEYTPGVGALNIYQQMDNVPAELRANAAIDTIAKNFTGLTLIGAGIFLASKGWLRGLGPGDKEDETREDLGEKTYSLKIGNQYFDTSFLAPSTIPLFEGVEIYNSFKDKDGFDANTMIDTLFGSLNPTTDMSVMQSVLSLMQSVGRKGNKTQNLAAQTFSNYLMQYFPTFLSQIAQASDEYQRDAYTQKSVLGKTFDQIKYKIPLARQTLPKKIDVWGEEKKNAENPVLRAVEAFLSPSNRSKSKVDETTEELFNLKKRLPDTKSTIIPSKKDKTFEIDGKNYEAKGKDYENLQKTYGKTAKKEIDNLIKSDSYKNASDEDKAYMVDAIYDYANYKAKQQYSDNNSVDFANSNTNRYALIDAFGIDFSKYIEQRISKIKSDKDENGNSLNNVTSKYIEAYNKMGLTDLQKQALMNFDNKSYYIDEDAVKNKINSSNLSSKQKQLLIEKFNKNVTDSEREKYKRAKNIGVSYDLYAKFRSYAQNVKSDKDKNGKYITGSKKKKIIQWIDSQNISAKQKQKLYDDWKNNQGIMSYYK